MFTYSVISATLVLFLVHGNYAIKCWNYGVTLSSDGSKMSALNHDQPTDGDCPIKANKVCLSGKIILSTGDEFPVGFCANSYDDQSKLMTPGLGFEPIPDPPITVKEIESMEVCNFDSCNAPKSSKEFQCYQYNVELDGNDIDKIVKSSRVDKVLCSGVCVYGSVNLITTLRSNSFPTNEVDSHFFYNSPSETDSIEVGFCSTGRNLPSLKGKPFDDGGTPKKVDSEELRGCELDNCNKPNVFMCNVYGVITDEEGKPTEINDSDNKIQKCPDGTTSCISGFVEVPVSDGADETKFRYVGFCNNNYHCDDLHGLDDNNPSTPVRPVGQHCTDKCDFSLCNKKPKDCHQYGASVENDNDLKLIDTEVSEPCPPSMPHCLEGSTDKDGFLSSFRLCSAATSCSEFKTSITKTHVIKCKEVR